MAGGIAGILAHGSAPAYAQGSTVHWLRWNDFVPASDQLLRKELLPEAEKALGIRITFETVNANDLQPRITSAIQSGAGPDLIMLNNNHPQLYAESVVDLTDIVEALGKAEGGHYPLVRANSNDGRKWLSMPWAIIGAMIAYRKSWFAEVGANTFPETWEAYREVGKRLKAKGRPIGQTLGHTFGDAPTFSYPFLWSWGGKEVEADGRTVVLNSKETVESVNFMTAFWKEAHDEGGLAWDDTNNNRAFLAQTISATLNGASIYIESLRNPNKYLTPAGTPLKDDILHSPLPKGPAGQFAMHTYHSHVLPQLLEEPGCGEATPAVGPFAARLREMVHLAEGLRHALHGAVGGAHGCGARTPSWLPTRWPAASAARRATPVPRAPRPPRCCPSTSSRTCTPRPSRACRPPMLCAGRKAELRRVYG